MSQITKGVAALYAEAQAQIETWPIDKAKAHLGENGVVFVDVRDVRELWREGTIPGAVHAPRGMIEFWVDPESPYARELFQSGKRFVFFCAKDWRSAFTTKAVQDMGWRRCAIWNADSPPGARPAARWRNASPNRRKSNRGVEIAPKSAGDNDHETEPETHQKSLPRARIAARDPAGAGGAMSLSLLKFVGQASLVDDAMLPS